MMATYQLIAEQFRRTKMRLEEPDEEWEEDDKI